MPPPLATRTARLPHHAGVGQPEAGRAIWPPRMIGRTPRSAPRRGAASRLVTQVVMALAFFAVPLVFIGFEASALRDSLADEVDTREMASLLGSLRTIKDRQYLPGACQNAFAGWCSQAAAASSPRQVLAEMRRRVPADLGLPMEFVFLGPDGRQDQELSDVSLPGDIERFLEADLARLEAGKPGPFRSRLARYQEFFGPWIYRLERAKLVTGFFQVGAQERRHHLYVSPRVDFGRFLVFLDHPPDWNLRGVRLELARHLARFPTHRGGIHRTDQGREDLPDALGEGFPSWFQASLHLGPSTRQAIRSGDWLWAQVPLDRKTRVILGRPDTSRRDLDRFRHGLLATLTGLFLGAAAVFFRLSASPEGIPFRLSTRLFLLLAYVVGLPLLVFWLSARTLGRDLAEVREREWQARQVAALEELDQRFQDFVGSLEEALVRRFQLTATGTSGETELRTRLQDVIREFDPALAVYLDAQGKARFESGAPSFKMPPGLQKILFTACAGVLASQTARPQPRDGDLSAALAEESGLNLELLTTIMTEHPEHLLDLDFIDQDVGILLTPASDPQGEMPFAVVVAWEHARLWRLFLERFLPRFQAGLPEMRLAARWIVGKNIPCPADSPLLPVADDIWEGFRGARRPVSLSVPLASSTWLVTGYRGNHLRNLLLLAGSPPDARQALDAAFHRRMALIGLLLALTGALIARLLSGTFLHPIGELARGVAALTRRDFSWRIPPIGRDELGRLGEAFNQMRESLRDLELARVLQERIYPTGVTSLGQGWEVFGDCRSASEVGGDFFDFQSLPDGRWILVVGDVSGHGAPSALIVALAKGLFAHPRQADDPARILQDVQAVFRRILPKRRMMMTCFVAVFDPVSGGLCYSNAGHNHPFLVNPAGHLSPLHTPGFPLGLGKARTYQSAAATVDPGGLVFLYTDGLVEALDPQGNPLGYEVIEHQVPALVGCPAREGVARLRAWHDTRVGSGPPADDITVVILNRRP
ncbi:MAG: SpoIIE family protein phosphatase [Candidatus Riflebacteria bacterium]|nr:SpoIIE family protein phosphatase [Candidatus Riflebacteria bacterium]